MLFVPHGGPQIAYGGSPSGNGDVNGSGAIDIADAIYLLTYLFAKGPVPEPIACPECPACDSCCPPPSGGALPVTGQTKCYDGQCNEMDCATADYPRQDGFYQTGCPMAGRFTDNGDGTVTDKCTGLMWQKDTAQETCTWQDALLYCEHLEFAGHSDWRLTNVRELQSIVDYGRTNPAIDTVFGAVSEYYWSSSTWTLPVSAWTVYFWHGDVVSGLLLDKDGVFYVRAVRDAR